MWTWDRARGTWRSKYFLPKEFECTCGVCSHQKIEEELVELLDRVREDFGAPITITSGFRCKKRQEDLRKSGLETAKNVSSHEMGQAADLFASDISKLSASILKVFGPYSIGIAKNFIHVDIRRQGPRRWFYK